MDVFHPLVRDWFHAQIGTPTDIQALSWPRIAAGEHLLITAPTGSGKTLTAFLWALNQLVTGAWETGSTQVLYISPLKALNNDIYRNLLKPLSELETFFEANEVEIPQIRVMTRSGDTPTEERRRMQRKPPEILITTPESLNLLLSSQGGRFILGSIKTVILDEIHAVVANKRGTHLMTGVERLVELAGDFQRVALSATVRPLEGVAAFVAGYQLSGSREVPEYKPRSVQIVKSDIHKNYTVNIKRIDFPEVREDPNDFWKPLAHTCRTIIERNRSTLVFVNSRSLCEQLTLLINTDADVPVAYAHHGSLAREVRYEVEQKLKAGDLKAIVATHSLEMGIDIGTLDEVILVQSPSSISSAIQRIGRAGHQVGEISQGTFFPTHEHDLLEAALLANQIAAHNIEAMVPINSPLDILAQVIVSMVGTDAWDIDDLYNHIRCCSAYHTLGRKAYDLVLNMMAGRYAHTRLQDLQPLISIDKLENCVYIRKGAMLKLYMSGGTIPNRGYFQLKHGETNAHIGELDEEFVWERTLGDVFTLGTQSWRIENITHNDVLVKQVKSAASSLMPFWKNEQGHRDFYFSEQISNFLETANARLEEPMFVEELAQNYHLEADACEQLRDYLLRQKTATQRSLPHRHHILIEHVKTGPQGAPGQQIIIHNFWGGLVNQPYALALDAAWQEAFGHNLEVYPANDCIMLMTQEEINAEKLLSLVTSGNFMELLKKRLENSGFFGARFRECAGRALLLSNKKMNQRMPLWMSRLKSKKLLETVSRFDDFPVLLEAWRTCLQDEFELDPLEQLLCEIEQGVIQWSEIHTSRASPMGVSMSWRQVNLYMYKDDVPEPNKKTQLRGDLLRDVVFNADLRPAIPPTIIEQFESKRMRLSPGYAPTNARELLDWVVERLFISSDEWSQLLKAIELEIEGSVESILIELKEKLNWVQVKGAEQKLIIARELLSQVKTCFELLKIENLQEHEFVEASNDDSEETDMERGAVLVELIGQWLQYYGPIDSGILQTYFGLQGNKDRLLIDDLIETETIIEGLLIEGGRPDVLCSSANFDILLRMNRKRSFVEIEPLDSGALQLFVAHHQGLVHSNGGVDAVRSCLELLACLPITAQAWERDVLPARIPQYVAALLDSVMQEAEFIWSGQREQQIVFSTDMDQELLGSEVYAKEYDEVLVDECYDDDKAVLENLFSAYEMRVPYKKLISDWVGSKEQLNSLLWRCVWRGWITNDAFMALRQAISHKFKLPQMVLGGSDTNIGDASGWRKGRLGRRMGQVTDRKGRFLVGNWYRLQPSKPSDEILESEERNKERVRLLLQRYGVLFREIVQREALPFRWPQIFRTLRLMELSGEVVAGYFFKAVKGPQFISHEGLRLLNHGLSEKSIYWMHATDPASMCGVGLEDLKSVYPSRNASTHLVFHGKKLVMVSKRSGKVLQMYFEATAEQAHKYIGILQHLLSRDVSPIERIIIEEINGEPAISSEYATLFDEQFDATRDHKQLSLYRKLV